MDIEDIEKVDALIIAKLILAKLNIPYSNEKDKECLLVSNQELEKAIESIEKIEDQWGVSKDSDEHSFGRKQAGEVIRIWSVPQKSAKVLKNLVILTSAKNILEVGTSAGYAALYLGNGAEFNDGKVYTIEILKEKIDLATENIEKSGLKNIQLIKGEASEVLNAWDKEKIDFVFLDADKENYGKYLDLLLPIMKIGGLIVADNINDYGHMMEDYLQRVSGTHLPKSRTDHRVKSYYLAALDNGLMVTQKISEYC